MHASAEGQHERERRRSTQKPDLICRKLPVNFLPHPLNYSFFPAAVFLLIHTYLIKSIVSYSFALFSLSDFHSFLLLTPFITLLGLSWFLS